MEWRECYLDAVLVPSGVLVTVLYHLWLWRKVRRHPRETDIGIAAAARARWVRATTNQQQHSMLVVQTIRNSIMGSTLMATTSVLLSSGLTAVLSSTTYGSSVEKPLEGSVYGAHGGLVLAFKYGTLLLLFLFAFLSYSLSIGFMNQASFLINIPFHDDDDTDDHGNNHLIIRKAEYASGLLERGFGLQVMGSRLFYAALPLVLWIFGPVLMLLCSLLMVSMLYNVDIVTAAHPHHPQNKAAVQMSQDC